MTVVFLVTLVCTATGSSSQCVISATRPTEKEAAPIRSLYYEKYVLLVLCMYVFTNTCFISQYASGLPSTAVYQMMYNKLV